MTKLKSITKRTLSVLLCMVMVLSVFISVPFTASAAVEYSFEENGVRYLENENGELEIVGFNSETAPEDVVIPETVQGKTVIKVGDTAHYGASFKSIVLPETITKIEQRAFSWCSKLESVTILSNITTIDDFTFEDCTSLKEVNLPDSLVVISWQAFGGCTSLESIHFPKNFEVIGYEAFLGCTSLKQVTINPALHSISDKAFKGITALTDVIFEERTTPINIGWHSFENCENLSNFDFTYCQNIEIGAFRGCKSLTAVIMSDDIYETSSIGSSAFAGCTNLKTVKLSNNINTIPSECFSGCKNLESIQTGTIKSIGYNAFSSCAKLTEISFAKDNNISKVGMNAFKNCTMLTEIALHDVGFIDDSAFENCTSLTNVCLEGNTKLDLIDPRAFFGCTSLEVIDIPATCKTIDDEAFMNCESLYYVDIKSGLETIGEKAFFNCHSLYEMIIPKSVEKIGGLALGCYEKDGKYYSYGDFIVAGVKSSLADEYAEAYNMYWALNAPKLTKIENTSSGVKITFSKPSGASSGKYEVYRCTDNTEWKLLGTTTSLSYTDKTAKAGTKYYYTVQFIGKPTNSINDYPLEMVRLSTPKVSKITNTNSGAQLTWGKITGAKKYIVYVKSSSGWKKLGDTTSTSFTHTAAKSGTSYTYTVRACDSSGSYKSAYVSAGYTNKFIAPPTLKAVSNTTSGAKITWNKSTGATKYRVFVKSGSSWKKLGDTSSTSFTHKSAKSGTKYTYTVRCLSSTGKSYVSGYDKTGISGVYLSAPKVSKISNAQNGAKLTWGKVAGATKYNIYVKSGSKWKKIDETTKTSYTHTAAKSGKSYTYTVRAYDSSGAKSAYVSEGYKNKFIATPVITSLSSTKKGVKISWGAVEGAVNYRVLVKTSSGWKKVGDTTSTSLVDKSTKNGKSYTYIVRCLSSTGKSYVSGYDKAGTTVTYKK